MTDSIPTQADADPSATSAEVEHFGAIARQLTESRRQILEIIEADGPLGLTDLVARWRTSAGGTPTAGRARHQATGLLWKLEALGWVAKTGGEYRLTGQGRAAIDR